jgi:hypothetical protein
LNRPSICPGLFTAGHPFFSSTATLLPTSAVAHYIAGVLDRESMEQGLNSLAELADFRPGDRIKTLRGSTHGVIVRLQPDGKVVWRPDQSSAELIALPESLLRASG